MKHMISAVPFDPHRRGALALLANSLAGIALSGIVAGTAGAADVWPTRTVRIIVPFAAGGPADSAARVLADVMAPQLGQPVVVENRPGAGSAIGVVAAAQSRDGHTLLVASNSMVINPALNPSVGYDVGRDFDAVGMVAAQPLMLVVPSNSEIKSFSDLITRYKGKADELTASNSGIGTLAHLTSEIFSAETGVPLTPVPYKGESTLLPDLISGRVSLGFLNLPSVAPLVKEGKLRGLGVSSEAPVPELPDVPTFRSLNYPSLEVQGWSMLVAPKGTIPVEGLARLEDLLARALKAEAVQTRLAALNQTPVVQSRQATADFLKAEEKRYGAIIKAQNIRPQQP
jgi:tripartite-type tricarboxylate transporter receptor subunit TctC